MNQADPKQWEIRHYEDVRVSVKYRVAGDWVDFVAAEFFDCTLADGSVSRQYAKSGSPTNNPTETDFDNAQAIMTGHVKWDGCANFDLQPDECMVHFCSEKGIADFALIMRCIYREAGAMMPWFEGELLEGQ